MPTERKHAALIKEWAADDRIKVEVRDPNSLYRAWQPTPVPSWSELHEYRLVYPPARHQEYWDAWKEGKKVQYTDSGYWITIPGSNDPNRSFWDDRSFWDTNQVEFRIVPEEVSKLVAVKLDNENSVVLSLSKTCNLNLTFVDGKLTKAEVL